MLQCILPIAIWSGLRPPKLTLGFRGPKGGPGGVPEPQWCILEKTLEKSSFLQLGFHHIKFARFPFEYMCQKREKDEIVSYEQTLLLQLT